MSEILEPRMEEIYDLIREELRLADLVIGSVLIPGAKAPVLVSREDLKVMKPGSVIIDVCIATMRGM